MFKGASQDVSGTRDDTTDKYLGSITAAGSAIQVGEHLLLR